MAWTWKLAAVSALLLAGCGGGGGAGAASYVGTVTNSGQDAVVGAVSDGATVSFYVCGGPSSYATETQWILGAVGAGGGVDMTSGGWHVIGDLVGGSGQVETDQGQTLFWQVRPATGGLEGVYQTMDDACRTGAVVADFGDGMGTRLQGTWCDGASHFEQVTPIDSPLTLVEAGILVEVQGATAKQLVVDRLVAPLPLP